MRSSLVTDRTNVVGGSSPDASRAPRVSGGTDHILDRVRQHHLVVLPGEPTPRERQHQREFAAWYAQRDNRVPYRTDETVLTDLAVDVRAMDDGDRLLAFTDTHRVQVTYHQDGTGNDCHLVVDDTIDRYATCEQIASWLDDWARDLAERSTC